MSKSTITVLVVIAIAVLGILIGIGIRNSIIVKGNAIDKAWADVQSAYQRRLDVLPKFAENAKFSAKFQKDLAIGYAEARKDLGAPSGVKPDSFASLADQGFKSLVVRVQQEAVPEAKLDQLTELNAQIENIERVIEHQRDAFNAAVQDYNNQVKTVPGCWFGFSPRQGFQAQPGAENSPDLHMNN